MPSPLLDGRPYDLAVPEAYDRTKPTALVLSFHGYGDGDTGKLLESYFRMTRIANDKVFLYAALDGTKDKDGQQFWNGTDACCDFYRAKTDDVAYVSAVIDDVAAKYNLDPKRVYVTGISGGGIFAHRLACDLSDRIAAVVSLSGATYKDASKCKPTGTVAIAEVHGDKDDVVLYDGGRMTYAEIDADYPSAHDTVAHWAAYNGCAGGLVPTGQTFDIDSKVTGSETKIERYDGCAKGAVELWTMQGGPHAPHLSGQWAERVWDFFAAHPKP